MLGSIPCLLEWKTLLINTLKPYHRGNMMNAWGNVYAMHDKNAFYLQTQELERPSLLTHNALGIMVHSQSLPWCPMHAFKKVMWTFRLSHDQMTRQMQCTSDDTVWVRMRESMWLIAQRETYWTNEHDNAIN